MNNDSIGALWTKMGGKGEYLAGQIEINGEKIGVVVFKNTSKKTDKQPDWKIYKIQKREEVKAKSEEKQPLPPTGEQDDIPF